MPFKDPVKRAAWQKQNRRKLRDERKALLLKDAKCIDCGIDDIRVLDFHHRDRQEKELGIAKAYSYSLERIMNETAKCDILCANCHRIRHYGLDNRISP